MKDSNASDEISTGAASVEEVLLKHPDITAAAVIQVPERRPGETLHAFVEIWGCIDFDAESAKRWVNTRLCEQQQIDKISIMNRLPRNSSGEVARAKLRHQADVCKS